ncbi:MAG: hypothetical protein ACKO3N_04130, partial [Verrucomicrobiota bacterium]
MNCLIPVPPAPRLGRIAPLALTPLALAVTLAVAQPATAQAVPVGNASFESPATTFVNPFIDGWRKTPQPS